MSISLFQIFLNVMAMPTQSIYIQNMESFSSDINFEVTSVDWHSYAQNQLADQLKSRATKLNLDFASGRAGLSNLKSSLATDDLCAEFARTYIEVISAGGSPDEASALATSLYVFNFKAGAHMKSESPCEAVEFALRNSMTKDETPTRTPPLVSLKTLHWII